MKVLRGTWATKRIFDVVTLLKGQSSPLVVEDCWAIKKARINGCRKKRSFCDELELDDVVVQNEQELDDVVLQNGQNLDNVLVQNDAVFDLVMHHDKHLDDDVVKNVVQTEAVAADVVQTEPILKVVLPTEATVGYVVHTVPHVDVVVPNEPIPASLVKKTKSLSELGVVGSRSGKKKNKSSGKK
ncbi:hypothetical protein D1007_57792 [Hordeum vulgare]|nr:hypothetical protein D1007_57792 [Hordeum vulgare]